MISNIIHLISNAYATDLTHVSNKVNLISDELKFSILFFIVSMGILIGLHERVKKIYYESRLAKLAYQCFKDNQEKIKKYDNINEELSTNLKQFHTLLYNVPNIYRVKKQADELTSLKKDTK